MKNIYLIGFMCSGKSSTAKQIARKLSIRVIDLDECIKKSFEMDIGSIFDIYGEEIFRQAESEILESIINSYPRGVVISLGGGTIFQGQNLELIRKTGIVIFLRATPQTIYIRASKSRIRRPLLEVEDKMGEIKRLYESRESIYEQGAHIIVDIDGKTSYEVARLIISSIKKRGGK
ncbi:MAG: shikimate kinase [Filifactoraceae bacterium]